MSPMNNDDELMRVSAIAARLKVSKMTVYRSIHAGRLPAIRIGRTYRVYASVVDEYLESAAYTPDVVE